MALTFENVCVCEEEDTYYGTDFWECFQGFLGSLGITANKSRHKYPEKSMKSPYIYHCTRTRSFEIHLRYLRYIWDTVEILCSLGITPNKSRKNTISEKPVIVTSQYICVLRNWLLSRKGPSRATGASRKGVRKSSMSAHSWEQRQLMVQILKSPFLVNERHVRAQLGATPASGTNSEKSFCFWKSAYTWEYPQLVVQILKSRYVV